MEEIKKSKVAVVLMWEEIQLTRMPCTLSAQSKVFFGFCPYTKREIVVKQVNLLLQP
jgi:serine/threonine protein kinase